MGSEDQGIFQEEGVAVGNGGTDHCPSEWEIASSPKTALEGV